MKKLKTFDSSYFRGKNCFEDNGTQNYLIFQPIYKYFEITPTTNIVLSWKSKGLPDETIKTLKPHAVLAPEFKKIIQKNNKYIH